MARFTIRTLVSPGVLVWRDQCTFLRVCKVLQFEPLTLRFVFFAILLIGFVSYLKFLGKHSSISELSKILAISYVVVQVFEYMYARQFRSVPAATAIFQTCQFLSLSSINFLTLLDYRQSSQQQGLILELSPDDLDRFRTLRNANKQLQVALKLSRKHDRNNDGED